MDEATGNGDGRYTARNGAVCSGPARRWNERRSLPPSPLPQTVLVRPGKDLPVRLRRREPRVCEAKREEGGHEEPGPEEIQRQGPKRQKPKRKKPGRQEIQREEPKREEPGYCRPPWRKGIPDVALERRHRTPRRFIISGPGSSRRGGRNSSAPGDLALVLELRNRRQPEKRRWSRPA